jgi:hypothetical protein
MPGVIDVHHPAILVDRNSAGGVGKDVLETVAAVPTGLIERR